VPDRSSIHKLVDGLPNEALETAEQILRSSQTWKPQPPPDVRQMRQSVKERMAEDPNAHFRELVATGGPKIPIAFSPDDYRESSGEAWEGETLVIFRICRLQQHDLEIEERFSLSEDKSKLLYSQQVHGPNGNNESFDVKFECQ